MGGWVYKEAGSGCSSALWVLGVYDQYSHAVAYLTPPNDCTFSSWRYQTASYTVPSWAQCPCYANLYVQLNTGTSLNQARFDDGFVNAEGAGTYYYHPDHLSTRAMTDSSGNLVLQHGHYPFGEDWYNSGSTTSKWKFTSYERDEETGNDYALARFHVNRLGRFASPDAISGNRANPQSLNRYSYTLNNPINAFDPFGFDAEPSPNDPDCTWDDATNTLKCPPPPPLDPVDNPVTNPLTPPPGGGGNPYGNLVSQALVALLNPDCSGLFGGFKNGVNALLNSNFDSYTPGQSNPYPNRIPQNNWTGGGDIKQGIVQIMAGGAVGATSFIDSIPGGNVFFSSQFNGIGPGYSPVAGGFGQMTYFLHELEHAANHNQSTDHSIDSNYDANYKLINSKCKPTPIETEMAPITGELVPPS